jgi:ABC-type dipeptide/oligopeptide/nickel transport system permease subunit
MGRKRKGSYGLAILITVAGFELFRDGLRGAVAPRLKSPR